MSAIVGCFNERAQKLLELHLASGFSKCLIWFKGKLHGTHGALIQEGKDLVTYALINAIAIRKILKKYDKVCFRFMFVPLCQVQTISKTYVLFFIVIFINLLFLVCGAGSLFKARAGLQVTSTEYARWNLTVSVAVWAHGFPYQFEGHKSEHKEGPCVLWRVLS